MPVLSDYYRDLQVWENVPPKNLVAEWPDTLVASVISQLHAAITASGILGATCPILKGSTNQSIGNQVEEFTIPLLSCKLAHFTLRKCVGAGYPDCELTQERTGIKMPLEVKATADWSPGDSSRRVLTSSSAKLRSQFAEPIYHLLTSIVYRGSSPLKAVIESIRLDFLEPTTVVGVRLEASVSHKILCAGSHRSIVF